MQRKTAAAPSARPTRDAENATDAVRSCPCTHPEPDTAYAEDQRRSQRIPEPLIYRPQPLCAGGHGFQRLYLPIHALQGRGIGGAKILAARGLGNLLQGILVQIVVAAWTEKTSASGSAHADGVDPQSRVRRKPCCPQGLHYSGVALPVGQQDQHRLAWRDVV